MVNEGNDSTPAAGTKDCLRPTNLILYGPPGTGKTYHTAAEAVRLCDGSVPSDRNDLMRRYRELLAAKRIAFVTFHQSYAYEDFVEGLRPVAGGEDEDDVGSTGFSLRPQDGVFKEIADLARSNRGKPVANLSPLLDRNRKAFTMSLGRSSAAEDDRLFQDAIAGGYLVLGVGGDVDWTEAKYADFKEFKRRWNEGHPEASGYDPNLVQTYNFRVAMQIGSLVVISDGNRKFRAVGEIKGDYRFQPGPDGNHRRAVKWLWHGERSLPQQMIYGRGFKSAGPYRLDNKVLDWDALSQIVAAGGEVSGAPEPFVLIIDEINRANVSKVFGELITLIEPDKRAGSKNSLTVTLPYSKTSFNVPANLHIVGTMNTADRSIALLDTALRRRFRFKELMPDPSLLGVVDEIDVGAALSVLNARIEYHFDRDHQIGHAYFMDCSSRSDLDLVMRETVIPLLVEYFYEDWEKVRDVLGESTNDGAFIRRERLRSPREGNVEDDDDERWRYTVKRTFAPDAYERIQQ